MSKLSSNPSFNSREARDKIVTRSVESSSACEGIFVKKDAKTGQYQAIPAPKPAKK